MPRGEFDGQVEPPEPGADILRNGRIAWAGLCTLMHNAAMKRTTIVAQDALLTRLRRIAAERGTSFGALVREALEEKALPRRPRPRCLGVGASGHTDTAERSGAERPVPRSWC